jgi:hypothetical protein
VWQPGRKALIVSFFGGERKAHSRKKSHSTFFISLDQSEFVLELIHAPACARPEFFFAVFARRELTEI